MPAPQAGDVGANPTRATTPLSTGRDTRASSTGVLVSIGSRCERQREGVQVPSAKSSEKWQSGNAAVSKTADPSGAWVRSPASPPLTCRSEAERRLETPETSVRFGAGQPRGCVSGHGVALQASPAGATPDIS